MTFWTRVPLVFGCLLSFLIMRPSYAIDIYEDASAYGYDLKQEVEDEIFFYEARFIDVGMHLGGRTFTGGLGTQFGTGLSFGGFLTYYFTRRFGMEFTINDSIHQFLIDGVAGWSTLIDILVRGKYYFISDKYSKALLFANPHVFVGGGQFIRTKGINNDTSKTQDNGFGAEFGAGFEVPIQERTLFLGAQASFQLIFFNDENDRADLTGIPFNGDAINFVTTLTYSF